MKKSVCFLLFVMMSVIIFGNPGTSMPGGIKGIVIDSQTEQPLPGVNVFILDSEIGTATDENGHFNIEQLKPGSYHVRFIMMGYLPQTKLNLPVSPDKDLVLRINLEQTVLEMQDVVVSPGFFKKAKDAVISERTMDFTEITSDPGSSMDVQRMMQSLPSVVSGTDQENEVVIRGGAPGENLFVIDHIEIPNPNHFSNQGVGGGPIGIINPLFINEISFYAGSFPARYGDKASSVMDIQLREGNRDNFEAELDMGMAGIGALLEGPIANGKGSYMLSYHKSYLELIIANTGLTAIPKYYNMQGKIVYDLTKKHKLIWNGIYGNDRIDLDEDAYTDIENIYIINVKGSEYATGLSWRGLWSKNIYSLLTLYRVENNWGVKVSEGSGRLQYKKNDMEADVALKGDIVYRLSPKSEITTGFSIKKLDYNFDNWAARDTLFKYSYFVDGASVTQPIDSWPYSGTIDSSVIADTLDYYNEWEVKKTIRSRKYAAHIQYKWNPFQKLTIISGLRYDYFAYTDFHSLVPRLGISYNFTPVTRLNFGCGRHYQSPVNFDLAKNKVNKSLKNKYTDQIVLGFEHLLSQDIRATIEVYSRKYHDIPVDISMTTPDSLDKTDDEMVNKGKGHVEGVEFFLQKKLFDRFHWILSYSYYVSKLADPRYPGTEYNSSFDYRNVFTLVLGYKENLREKAWYRKMKEKTWYKLTGWLLPFGDEVEISMRWRYLGGKPYTEQNYDPYTKRWYLSANQDLNADRFPSYHRLDIMLIQRYIYKKMNLVFYLDIQNIYNQSNIWDYNYTKDGKKETLYQYEVFPIGGFTLEF